MANKDLIKIFDSLNKKYFKNEVYAGICWRTIRLGRERVTLGVCSTEERVIRINDCLQDPRVPLWYVKYIVFHEMIHALQGPLDEPHNEEFYAIERTYPDYEKAIEFEEKKLHKILDGHRRVRKNKKNVLTSRQAKSYCEEDDMSDDKNKKERTSITIDPELLATVKTLAKSRDQSVSQFISTALKKFIE